MPTTQPAARSATELESIDILYERYGQRIFRFVLASIRDRDVAETLTQDTFIRAWSARDQFRGDCAPATWLTRIALNLVRDHTRTNRFRFWRNVANTAVDATEFASFLPDTTSSAEDALIAKQQVALLWHSVEALSERQRTVFLLRFVEDMDLAEIADMTSMPISTVKTHLYRGLAIVREHQKNSAKPSGKETK
jgi:RNA polymerase sigma-70 factor (ECF subfamily)